MHFTYLESTVRYITIHRDEKGLELQRSGVSSHFAEQIVCLKRLKTTAFGCSEPLHLLRLMGVSVPSLHIESTDSVIYCYLHIKSARCSLKKYRQHVM